MSRNDSVMGFSEKYNKRRKAMRYENSNAVRTIVALILICGGFAVSAWECGDFLREIKSGPESPSAAFMHLKNSNPDKAIADAGTGRGMGILNLKGIMEGFSLTISKLAEKKLSKDERLRLFMESCELSRKFLTPGNSNSIEYLLYKTTRAISAGIYYEFQDGELNEKEKKLCLEKYLQTRLPPEEEVKLLVIILKREFDVSLSVDSKTLSAENLLYNAMLTKGIIKADANAIGPRIMYLLAKGFKEELSEDAEDALDKLGKMKKIDADERTNIREDIMAPSFLKYLARPANRPEWFSWAFAQFTLSERFATLKMRLDQEKADSDKERKELFRKIIERDYAPLEKKDLLSFHIEKREPQFQYEEAIRNLYSAAITLHPAPDTCPWLQTWLGMKSYTEAFVEWTRETPETEARDKALKEIEKQIDEGTDDEMKPIRLKPYKGQGMSLEEIVKSKSLSRTEKSTAFRETLIDMTYDNKLSPELISNLLATVILENIKGNDSIRSLSSATFSSSSRQVYYLENCEKGVIQYYEKREPEILKTLNEKEKEKYEECWDDAPSLYFLLMDVGRVKNSGKYLYGFINKMLAKPGDNIVKACKEMHEKDFAKVMKILEERFGKSKE